MEERNPLTIAIGERDGTQFRVLWRSDDPQLIVSFLRLIARRTQRKEKADEEQTIGHSAR